MKALNGYLDTYENKVYEAKRTLIEYNQVITASVIKDILLGNNQRSKMLIKIFEDYNAKMKSLIGIDYSEATWTKYDRTKRFTKEFIRWKYKMDDIHIRQLNFEFVTQCELYYKTIRKCCHNTTLKYISILKTVVLFCVANRWIDHDPFALFEMVKDEVEPTFLTKDEIQTISGKPIKIDRLRRVRDIYIFCCFTGLAYADVEKLKRTEISIGVDNELWIFTDRLKTKIKSRVPLYPGWRILRWN